MKSGLFFGVVASSKTRVRCIFCGVFIPKASKCIEQHLNGARHKENVELMNENGIAFISDTLHCKPCKRNLPHEESVLKHIDEEDHANWMAAMEDLIDGEFISIDDYLSSEKDFALCEVCNCNIDCSLPCIEEHVNHIDHRTNITERLKPLNGIFSVDDNEVVWCKVCDVYVDNTIHNILNHIDNDEQHMEWFAEIEDLIEDQELSLESYLANEHDTNAYCKKCHMEVLCTTQDIRSHVHSEAHLNQFGL